MLWESLKTCTPVLHLQEDMYEPPKFVTSCETGSYRVVTGRNSHLPFSSSLKEQQDLEGLLVKSQTRVSVFKRVHFKIKTFQHWTNEPCSSLNCKLRDWVPGEKCSFPAGISWSKSSKAADMKKGKTFFPLKLQPKHQTKIHLKSKLWGKWVSCGLLQKLFLHTTKWTSQF